MKRMVVWINWCWNPGIAHLVGPNFGICKMDMFYFLLFALISLGLDLFLKSNLTWLPVLLL